MTEIADLPGVKPELQKEWKDYVEHCLDLDEAHNRQAALFSMKWVGALVKALADGLAPAEAIRLLDDPNLRVFMVTDIVRTVCKLSTRGEEFRLWWNSWHDAVHPYDVTPPTDQAALKKHREQPPVWTTGLFNFKGQFVQINAKFDPTTPLNKRPDYNEIVKNAVKSAGIEVAAV